MKVKFTRKKENKKLGLNKVNCFSHHSYAVLIISSLLYLNSFSYNYINNGNNILVEVQNTT